jgi:hypothetical protein
MSTEITRESTSLSTKSQADLDDQIIQAAHQLEDLASNADAKLKDNILQLAQLTRPGIAGMEGQQRVTIPWVLVRQPSSSSPSIPEDVKVGELYSSDGRIGDRLVILPILSHTIRRKWGEERVDCQSVDGVRGTRYGACEACPYGRYVEGQRTECSKGTSIYGVTDDLSALYRVDFTKSSAKAGQNILRLARPPALWARSFSISTEKKAAQKTNYYELKTALTGERTAPAVMQVCEALHTFYKALYDKAKLSLYRQNAAEARPANVVEATVVADSDGVVDFGSDDSI